MVDRLERGFHEYVRAAAEPAKKDDPAPRAAGNRAMLPGFKAGTPVWTLAGVQPVEALRTGDQVLAHDSDTGKWSYQAVLAVRQGVRQPIKKIKFSGASIETTGVERFWVAGTGWVLAGDLKPGDATRSPSGLRRVTAVEDDGSRAGLPRAFGPGTGARRGANSASWPMMNRLPGRWSRPLIARPSRRARTEPAEGLGR